MDSESYPQRAPSSGPPLRPDGITQPRPDRFGESEVGFADAMDRHREAIDAGSPGYLDPTSGLFVMTAAYLRDRRYCCDRGCRHCPFEPGQSKRGSRSEPDGG